MSNRAASGGNRNTQLVGEDAAAQLLLKLGYKVLARNWRLRMGELDIVATKGRTLVFVEVKTRVRSDFLEPSQGVDYRKQIQVRKMAEAFLAFEHYDFDNCRFDVISVVAGPNGPELRHIEDAF